MKVDKYPFPPKLKVNEDIMSLANELGVTLDDRRITLAVRQCLTNLKRVRRYKKRIREDPATRDEWYRKRREEQRKRRRKLKQKQMAPKANAKPKPAPKKKKEPTHSGTQDPVLQDPARHHITDDEFRFRRLLMITEKAEQRAT